MLDLASRIKSALENPCAVPWFPELTDELARTGWDALGSGIGLTTNDYSTARVLSANARAPQNIIAYLPASLGVEASKSTICIESLTEGFTRQYYEAGISFYTPEEINNTNVLNCLEDAVAILNRVPSLMPTVATVVRALHLIKLEDNDYDVSFSEPHIPFSIFVSVPKRHTTTNALRVAEAIVHEAMHLQLTLIEQVVPLLVQTQKNYYSPWRDEHRSAQGILHALYVFRVIYCFLEQLAFINGCVTEVVEYVQDRRAQIETEMREVRFFKDCSELTALGARFVKNLVQS